MPDRFEPTPRSLRLASKVREDHPAAVEGRCQIKHPHGPHPWGKIRPEGGLANWCKGRTI